MTFTDAAISFRLALMSGMSAYGYTGVPVIEADQRNKQGRVLTGIYYRMLMPNNYGWQARRYNVDGDNANHTEHQLYEVLMQLTSLVDDDDVTGYTANDLAATAQMVCNSLPFVENMRRAAIGVQRATPIRSIVFTDEHNNYAMESSFDVNITFARTIRPQTPVANVYDLDITRI